MIYKQSIFNNYFSCDNKKYVFNSLSGSLLSLDNDTFNYIDHIDINEHPEYNNNFDFFFRKGLIVKKDLDEMGYIFQKTQHHIYNQYPTHVSYTIAVTRKCNYKCQYCFEGNKKTGQFDLNANAVADFIVGQINTNPLLKHMRVTWFGGEPLLNKKAIIDISDRIISITKAKDIDYKASIITNGSLLDEEFIKKVKISSAQITLDGVENTYAEYKGTSIENYYKVIANIELLSKIKDFSLGIRVNCDRNNIESVFELVDLFDQKKLLNTTYIYLAQIYTGTISDLSDAEFYEILDRYYDVLYTRNCYNALKHQLHKSRIMSCGFMGYGSYVIDTDGTLKKCERDVGDDLKIIGDVYQGKFYNRIEKDYQQNDIIDKCYNCSIYPLCRGGCRKMREANKNVECELEKKHLFMLLKKISRIS